MQPMTTLRRVADNPFHVLELPPLTTRADMERQGQKLLGMLELGLAQAATYQTPVGMRQRTAELVRWAMAELREPDRRLVHEAWAALQAQVVSVPGDAGKTPPANAAGWPEALRQLGWVRP